LNQCWFPNFFSGKNCLLLPQYLLLLLKYFLILFLFHGLVHPFHHELLL